MSSSWVRFSDSRSPVAILNERFEFASVSDDLQRCPSDSTSSASAPTSHARPIRTQDAWRERESDSDVRDSDSDGQFFSGSSNRFESLSSSAHSAVSVFSCDSLNVDWSACDAQLAEQTCRPRLHLKQAAMLSEMHAEPLPLKRADDANWAEPRCECEPHFDASDSSQRERTPRCDNVSRLRRGSPVLFTSQYKSVNDVISRPIARRIVPPQLGDFSRNKTSTTTAWLESVSSESSKSSGSEFAAGEFFIDRRSSYSNAIDARKMMKVYSHSLKFPSATERRDAKAVNPIDRRNKSEPNLRPDFVLTAYDRQRCSNDIATHGLELSRPAPLY